MGRARKTIQLFQEIIFLLFADQSILSAQPLDSASTVLITILVANHGCISKETTDGFED
jgi:hypothetical protein